MIYFTKACVFFLAIAVSIYLFLAIYVAQNAQTNKAKPADVILVLGAKAYRDGSYNPCLVSRIEHAVELYKANYAPKLLLSGGIDKEDNISEAETMKKMALALGASSEDILLESASTSTYENLLFSKQLLEKNNLKSVILVTEAFHAPRASLIAEKLKLNAVSSPTTKSICWTKNRYMSRYFLKEPIAIIVYKLKGEL